MRRVFNILPVLLPTLLFLCGAIGAAGAAESRRVMTWIPPYAIDQCAQRMQEAQGGIAPAEGITHVGLQFWEPTTLGGIEYVSKFKRKIDDDTVSAFVRWGQANNTKILLCVYNGTSNWDWNLAAAAFDTHHSGFIESLVNETLRLQLDGVDIDLEGQGELNDSKEAFVRFIKKLSARLHEEGKELSVDTFAYKWHAPNQTWWTDLLPHVDGLNVMGYSETGAGAKDWRSYDFLKSAAGNQSFRLLIGMPSHKAKWQDASVAEHLQWVVDDPSVGLAFWDMQLTDSAWRTANVWEQIKRISTKPGTKQCISAAPKHPGWNLVWADEFNEGELDNSKWTRCRRGNADWQNTMSDDPRLLKLQEGALLLRGIANDAKGTGPAPFLTAGITSRGKFAFKHGKVQIRARFTSAQGAWPALWMLGAEGRWPACGEIDLMEHLNFDRKVYQTVHSEYTVKIDKENNPEKGDTARIRRDDWNTYGCEWDAGNIIFTVNGKPTHTYPRVPEKGEEQWPFDQTFYFMLTMQVGGQWVNGSGPTNPSHYPAGMEIDWVRVYRNQPAEE